MTNLNGALIEEPEDNIDNPGFPTGSKYIDTPDPEEGGLIEPIEEPDEDDDLDEDDILDDEDETDDEDELPLEGEERDA